MSEIINMQQNYLLQVRFNDEGLVAAVVQEVDSQEVLMQAWMNEAALQATVQKGEAVFWSRSRLLLWHKGETSGMVMRVENIFLDCDGDSILLVVRLPQKDGVACHTGRRSCYYRRLDKQTWQENAPIIHSPQSLYGKK